MEFIDIFTIGIFVVLVFVGHELGEIMKILEQIRDKG